MNKQLVSEFDIATSKIVLNFNSIFENSKILFVLLISIYSNNFPQLSDYPCSVIIERQMEIRLQIISFRSDLEIRSLDVTLSMRLLSFGCVNSQF